VTSGSTSPHDGRTELPIGARSVAPDRGRAIWRAEGTRYAPVGDFRVLRHRPRGETRSRMSHKDETHAGEQGVPKQRRGRGWGPFSGGQLTIIIGILAVVIGFPVAANAVVSGSNVFVTNATTGTRAAVNSSGALDVAGSVTATPTPPSASYVSVATAFEVNGCTSITPSVPVGKALVVTSITVRVVAVTTGPVLVDLVSAVPITPCSRYAYADEIAIPGAGASQIVPIASGFPVRAGHAVGVELGSNSGNAVVNTVVHGYLVSSTLCTVLGPPVGCN